jgi:methylenetetrahydrofolate dehydrogenase (NADP+)/methenyltetrahydrofolate cyclohydrolase
MQAETAIVKSLPGGGRAIDGRTAAAAVLARVEASVAALGFPPGLAVVLVGADPASQVYVKAKGNAARQCGFHAPQFNLPETTSEAEIEDLVRRLNADSTIHGILLQLPLPKGIDPNRLLELVTPDKDVDGFHPVNAGLLAIGQFERALVPCTPAGSMLLLRQAAQELGVDLSGQHAVVIGRSNIVGKPMAQLLLAENCTVTMAHSRSRDLAGLARGADILVAAVGRPEMVRGDWIKPGAIVIDVGINRLAGTGKDRLVGDVAFSEAAAHAGAITPVPGGVGPMTIAMLMANTCIAAYRSVGKTAPRF